MLEFQKLTLATKSFLRIKNEITEEEMHQMNSSLEKILITFYSLHYGMKKRTKWIVNIEKNKELFFFLLAVILLIIFKNHFLWYSA